MARVRRSAQAGRGVTVPGIYSSLLPWAQSEYAQSGDPRWAYAHHDGDRDTCRHGPGCGHGDPPPNPTSPKRILLDSIEAGRPVRVSHWIATGRRWREPRGWSEPVYDLPWDEHAAPFVTISADDTVRPARPGHRC